MRGEGVVGSRGGKCVVHSGASQHLSGVYKYPIGDPKIIEPILRLHANN